MAHDGGRVCQASQIPEDMWSVTDHTPVIMPQHGRECRRCVLHGPVRTTVSCAANYGCTPCDVPQTFGNGSAPHTTYACGYKGLNAVSQVVPISMCHQIAHQTRCGTDILASVA